MTSTECPQCKGTSFIHDANRVDELHDAYQKAKDSPLPPIKQTQLKNTRDNQQVGKQAKDLGSADEFMRTEPRDLNRGKQRNREAARIAIQSAKIVNAYGTYVQVIGIVVGVVAIIAGFVLASQNHSFIYGLSGLIVGALDIAIFAVQGALFRMISNYVIARLEE